MMTIEPGEGPSSSALERARKLVVISPITDVYRDCSTYWVVTVGDTPVAAYPDPQMAQERADRHVRFLAQIIDEARVEIAKDRDRALEELGATRRRYREQAQAITARIARLLPEALFGGVSEAVNCLVEEILKLRRKIITMEEWYELRKEEHGPTLLRMNANPDTAERFLALLESQGYTTIVIDQQRAEQLLAEHVRGER